MTTHVIDDAPPTAEQVPESRFVIAMYGDASTHVGNLERQRDRLRALLNDI